MEAAAPPMMERAARVRLMPERGTISAFEILLLVICIALVIFLRSQNLLDIAIQSFLWAAVALAWNIAGGYAGLISFGHAAFFGIGAYTSTILLTAFELTPWIGMWIGALFAGAFAALLT